MSSAKEHLASYALDYIIKNRVIGLGTGKTVRSIIAKLSTYKDFLNNKIFVGSSLNTELLLSNIGANVVSLSSGLIPDIYIDSFDIYNGNVLIKGRGGALFREKLLAYNSKLRLYLGDMEKYQPQLKVYQIPVEVSPFAIKYITKKLNELDIPVKVREEGSKIGPVISDNGNVLLDIILKNYTSSKLCTLLKDLKMIPGIIEIGIFCEDLYDIIVLADEHGKLEVIQKSAHSK